MRVGVVGLGVMGRTHFKTWSKQTGVKVAAICETNAAVIDRADAAGNIAQQGGDIDLEGVKVYDRLDVMLAEAQLDAISIALPTHLHAEYAVNALSRGCHVLCEKPMALTPEACDEMIAAARASGKILMVAQCIRFWPEYVWAQRVIEDGTYGALRAAHFWRLSTPPGWGKQSWFSDPAKSGGVTLDLHIHDLDFICTLFGKPRGMHASGICLENGMLGHIVSDCDYGTGKVITAEASWMMGQTFGFAMGFRIVLEGATLLFDTKQEPTLCVFPAKGETFKPELPKDDGYVGEVQHFADVINGRAELMVTPESTRDSVCLALEAEKVARG